MNLPRDRRLEPNKKVDENEPRVNQEITVAQVRLVGADGEMIGVVSTADALRRAEEEGLDLVEVAPLSQPPVCKILDYSKFRYEAQKKAKEARKKQKVINTKEIKFRPGIDQHDYEVKMRSAKRFLEEGDKVKFTLRFRGREMAHQEYGFELLKRVEADLTDIGKVELAPRSEGKQILMIVVPAK